MEDGLTIGVSVLVGVGSPVGKIVDVTRVGLFVEANDGIKVGELVNGNVGTVDGGEEGTRVRINDGLREGSNEGSGRVGADDGFKVGTIIGCMEGMVEVINVGLFESDGF